MPRQVRFPKIILIGKPTPAQRSKSASSGARMETQRAASLSRRRPSARCEAWLLLLGRAIPVGLALCLGGFLLCLGLAGLLGGRVLLCHRRGLLHEWSASTGQRGGEAEALGGDYRFARMVNRGKITVRLQC